jgi:RND family efflux transporter MFP subunit
MVNCKVADGTKKGVIKTTEILHALKVVLIKNILVPVILSLGLCVLFCGCAKTDKNNESSNSVKVKVSPLVHRRFQHRLRVQGMLQSTEKATIAARVSGIIDSLQVDDAVRVKKGQVLFQIDKENLENQVLLSQKALKVAIDMRKTVQADLAIARTNREKALLDFKRAKKLFKSQAISEDRFESASVSLKNTISSVNKAIAVLNYTETQIQQQEVMLKIAKKNLADSIITAPFSGVVTLTLKEEKEFVVAGTPILKLENQNQLELSSFLSAVYYNKLQPGVLCEILFNGKLISKAKLNYKACSVDPLSRTFEIRAQLPAGAKVTSGTLCDIDLILVDRSGYGLPQNAVMFRKGGKYIAYIAEAGKANEVPIYPGFTTKGYTEILNSDQLKNKIFIVTGQYFVNDGSQIEIEKAK